MAPPLPLPPLPLLRHPWLALLAIVQVATVANYSTRRRAAQRRLINTFKVQTHTHTKKKKLAIHSPTHPPSSACVRALRIPAIVAGSQTIMSSSLY
jgi:hypothetical protein